MSANTLRTLWTMLSGCGKASVPASRLATRGRLPSWLTESGLFKEAPPKPVQVPDCQHGCQLAPFKNDAGRLVVTCPNDPPCFEGYWELPEGEDRFLSLDVPKLIERMIAANGLRPFKNDAHAVEGCWFLGVKEMRDLRIFVYLAGEALSPSLIGAVADSTNTHVEHRAVLLHAGRADKRSLEAARRQGVTLHPLPVGEQWDFKFDWVEIADTADPTHLATRQDNNEFIFEDVALELSTDVGKRHRVQINGRDCPGFAESDACFSRLLLLAARRAAERNTYFGGWVEQQELGLDGKGRHLDTIRTALAKTRGCGLVEEDLRLLIRANPEGNGSVRLALDPANIRFDPSLKKVAPIQAAKLKAPRGKTARRGDQQHHQDLQKSVSEARRLFGKAIQLIVFP